MAVFRRKPAETPGPSQRAITASAQQPLIYPYNSFRAVTAAAQRLDLENRGEVEQFKLRRNAGSSQWQEEAWEYYDAIGEIKYAFNLVAAIISRIRLYPAVITDPSIAPTPVSDADSGVDDRLAAAAERNLARLDSAYGGQAGLLRDAALNLLVAGECYLVQMPARQGSGIPESWDIRSVDELLVDSRGEYVIVPRRELASGNSMSRTGGTTLRKGAFVGRVWRPHPRFSDEADSSLRGMLDLCAELLLLNRTFRATARSRLNAGALYLPDGLSVSAAPDPDYPFDEELGNNGEYSPLEAEDEFEEQLIDAMTTPITDEDSASAVVPLIIRGPAELGDKIKQFKFERSFDPALAERSDRVLERIMQGIDVPKDVVTGLASVKYSNAVQINESLYKSHVDPLMLLIVDALTIVYMRPALVAMGFTPEEASRITIWYDPTQVATRNDRAADADSGFDRYAVSYSSWRRAHGFSDTDAPTPEEVALRMMIDKGSVPPEMTQAMLTAIAPGLAAASRAAQQSQSVAPIPPEVQQLLNVPAPPAPTEGEQAAPASETPADAVDDKQLVQDAIAPVQETPNA